MRTTATHVGRFTPHKCKLPIKQEGEECGSCFSPDSNDFCGDCESGLDCVKDPANELLPDAASRCRKKKGIYYL